MAWYERLLPGGGNQSRIADLEARIQGLTEQRSIDTLPWNVGATTSAAIPQPSQALRLAPVFAAVSLIARSISTMPLHAYRKTPDGKSRMPYLPQLFAAPSIHGELTGWLHRLVMSLLLHGNAYGLITARDGHGYPTTIEWLDPIQVFVNDEGQWGRGSFWDPIYYWRGREIDAENLVHIPWVSVPFRVKGLSPMQAFASAVDIGLDGQTYVRDWYRAGGNPPGTFKNSGQKLNRAEASDAKNWLVSAIRTHEPIVYGNDWDYSPITINPKDSIFVETHQMSATDIAIVYGIYPAERIGGQTKTAMTYSNVEAEQIQFIQLTLLPFVLKLESVFFDLLPQPQFVKFNLDAQIRTDTKTRHETYQIARQIGLRNIDEIRDIEDMAPLPNGEGQSYNPLVGVRETIKADAVSKFNPNLPGFETAEPPAPAGAEVAAPGEPDAASTAQPTSNGTNGRFTGSMDELEPVTSQGANNGTPF